MKLLENIFGDSISNWAPGGSPALQTPSSLELSLDHWPSPHTHVVHLLSLRKFELRILVPAAGQDIDMQLYDRVQQQWVTLTIKDKFPVDEHDRPFYARPAGKHTV